MESSITVSLMDFDWTRIDRIDRMDDIDPFIPNYEPGNNIFISINISKNYHHHLGDAGKT